MSTPDTEVDAYSRGYKQGRFDSEMDRLNEEPTTPDTEEDKKLCKELRMVSNMINMGEKIQWARETTLMDKAAERIESLSFRDTYWKERVAEARVEAYNKVCLVRGNIRDPQLFIDTEMFVEALTPITSEDNLK